MSDMDEKGHFPGCYGLGCMATRCSDARYMRDYGRAEKLSGKLMSYPDVAASARPIEWEQQAIANAAAVLLNEGARDVAIQLLTYTRRR